MRSQEETMSETGKSKAVAVELTRRRAMAGLALAVGTLTGSAAAQVQMNMKEEQSAGTEGLLTYLHQEVVLSATPQRIYDVLLDSTQFAKVTGAPAEISREAGGPFSTFGGLIEGRNLELVPHQRIVQGWRPASWPPGVYSVVKFELNAKGASTEIVLDHTGFPEGNFRHLDSGWYLRYWEPLKKYLA
jgi:activator of HSP90 ATPase